MTERWQDLICGVFVLVAISAGVGLAAIGVPLLFARFFVWFCS